MKHCLQRRQIIQEYKQRKKTIESEIYVANKTINIIDKEDDANGNRKSQISLEEGKCVCERKTDRERETERERQIEKTRALL